MLSSVSVFPPDAQLVPLFLFLARSVPFAASMTVATWLRLGDLRQIRRVVLREKLRFRNRLYSVVEKLDVEANATVCGQMWTFDDLRGSAVNSLRSQCQQVIVLRLSFASGFDSEISFSRLHSLVMFDFDAFAALGAV
jgi:hypothetical protein